MPDKPPARYRWAAWSHWANLAFVAAAGLGGATIDPAIWLVALPIEALAVWLLPDLPAFRAAVDAAGEREALTAERAYYLTQLWGLRASDEPSLGKRLASLFVQSDAPPRARAEADDELDARLLQRPPDCERYLEMRAIVRQLGAMAALPRTRVTERDVRMLEHVVNGYLRLLLSRRPLQQALRALEQENLGSALADLHARLEDADAAVRPVLLERKRLLEAQLARAPKLRATLELVSMRADTLPHQLRDLHAQLLAEPGTEVQGVLEDMLERNELLADPLAELSVDRGMRELLGTSPAIVPEAKRPPRQGTTS